MGSEQQQQTWCGTGGQEPHPPCRVYGRSALPQPPHGVDQWQTEGPPEGGALGFGPQQPRVFYGAYPGHVSWSPSEGLQWPQQRTHFHPRLCFQWRQLLPCHQQWDFPLFSSSTINIALYRLWFHPMIVWLFLQMWPQLTKEFILVICTITTARFTSPFKSSSMSPSWVRRPDHTACYSMSPYVWNGSNSNAFCTHIFPARKEKRHWDGEKTVFVVLLGSSVALPCVNRRPLWREGLQEDQQQVAHWDFQAPGVRPDRADRLVDLYASGERRDYGPLFARSKMSVAEDAFTLGDFSLSISDLNPADKGLYSCHLHHHYCGLQERRIFRLTVGPPLPSTLTTAPRIFQNDVPEPSKSLWINNLKRNVTTH